MALVVVLAATNIALAVLYMSKNVNISGGVSAVGAIQVYDMDGITPLTGYDFPLFSMGTQESLSRYFFINNTGNQPVYVSWNISSSSIEWSIVNNEYCHFEDSTMKYKFLTEQRLPSALYQWWAPNTSLYLGVGEGKQVQNHLWYSGEPMTAEIFTLMLTFYAQDA